MTRHELDEAMLTALSNMTDPADRLMAADYAEEEMGLTQMARLLRDPELPVVVIGQGRLWAAGPPTFYRSKRRRHARRGHMHLYDPDGHAEVSLWDPWRHGRRPRWAGIWGSPMAYSVEELATNGLREYLVDRVNLWWWWRKYEAKPPRIATMKWKASRPEGNNWFVIKLTPEQDLVLQHRINRETARLKEEGGERGETQEGQR